MLRSLLCLATIATLVAGTTTPAGAGGRPSTPRGVDAAYAGFATPGVRSGGGYLGAHQVGGTVVYRVDPGRKAAATAFGPATPASLLVGSGKRNVTLSDTQRAAWIVSKYGALPAKVQAAAVELALDDLLVGGAYTLRGRQTRARLATLRKPEKVVEFAKTMLKGSRQRAGDYQVGVQATPSVDLGGQVTARVQVTASASALGVASLPVTFSLPGAPDQTVATDAGGVAVAVLPAGTAGPGTVTARVDRIPESRLIVLAPAEAGASRVVVAQVKDQRVLTAPVVVRARPRLDVTSVVSEQRGPAVVRADVVVSGTFDNGSRIARATLYGPSDTGTCTGTPRETVSFRVTPGTRTAIPSVTAPPGEGVFAWKVDVDGDASDLAASSCGGATYDHTKPVFVISPYAAGPSRGYPIAISWLAPSSSENLTVLAYAPGDGPCGASTDDGYYTTLTADAAGRASLTFPALGTEDYYAFSFQTASIPETCVPIRR